MRNQTSHAFEEGIELLGEWHPLLEQLGSAEGLVTLQGVAQSLELPRVESLADLIRFLECYRDKILLPLEFPVIYQAYRHAARNELRELLNLDQRAAQAQPIFASASRRVGQAGLKRLRPLRDQRLVQRYLRTVDSNEANGWHTVVYGLTLALYSWPVRQGLLHYAGSTLLGFLHPAARRLGLSDADSRQIVSDLSKDLPAALEQLLAQDAQLPR